MSFHAGMHGQMIAKRLLRKNKSTLLKIISYINISLLVAFGVFALKRKNIADYLFLRSQFVLIDFSQPAILAVVDYLLVSMMFMIVGYYIAKFTNCNFVKKHYSS